MVVPREHGAYGQLGFPLATALAAGGLTWPAVAFAVAAIAIFVAHEPLLVLLGDRGARARRMLARGAWQTMGVSLLLAAGTGVPAVFALAPDARWWLALPLALAALSLTLALAGIEKTAFGESTAVAALASASVPVALGGHVSLPYALAIFAVFTVGLVVTTLSVRVVAHRLRRRASSSERAVAVACSSLTIAVSIGLASARVVGACVPLALAPLALPSLAIGLFPPNPRRLRTLGWCLVAGSLLTAAVLVWQIR